VAIRPDIGSRTQTMGVIGDPIAHSLSPVMHNAALSHLGIDAVYMAFRVRPEGLGAAISGMREMGIAGLNVTIPHKANVMRHLDRIDDVARSIGAVNTVLNREGLLIGYNTDADGAMEALSSAGYMPGGQALLLGAGEAARAVGFALVNAGSRVMIANRNMERARALAEHLKAIPVAHHEMPERIERSDLIVNCTPLGMEGFPSVSPIDTSLVRPGTLCFDLVYNPMDTPFLRGAASMGARIVRGYEMLVGQGARSFEMFTGRKPPVEVMREAVVSALRGVR